MAGRCTVSAWHCPMTGWTWPRGPWWGSCSRPRGCLGVGAADLGAQPRRGPPAHRPDLLEGVRPACGQGQQPLVVLGVVGRTAPCSASSPAAPPRCWPTILASTLPLGACSTTGSCWSAPTSTPSTRRLACWMAWSRCGAGRTCAATSCTPARSTPSLPAGSRAGWSGSGCCMPPTTPWWPPPPHPDHQRALHAMRAALGAIDRARCAQAADPTLPPRPQDPGHPGP